ncbi:MAG: SEC-C metal-binding domain-containing protein [Lachnospiraceae bacterium]|jgi:uncharacterized protein
MTLLEEWRNYAYNEKDQGKYNRLWNEYFALEKKFYESLLSSEETVKGTIPEFCEKYKVDQRNMVGILDGINDSLKTPNPIETMDLTTELSLDYDKEKLYYNMVAAKAEWLYTLPQWDSLLTEERRKELYKQQKNSGTIRKGKKIGRNDPCPCGSGKKYKFCHGRNA